MRVNAVGDVNNSYTYNPFGQDLSTADCNENVYNPFKFTGQWWDSEIGQYYLRARMYDPHIGRFTSRDPVAGKFKEPISLHRYLYCLNDSINHTDPTGRLFGGLISSDMEIKMAGASLGIKMIATQLVATINMYNMMMVTQLQNFTVDKVVALSNFANNLALIAQTGGARALGAVSQFVSNYSVLKTPEQQIQFINGLLNQDPASSTVYEEQLGWLVQVTGKWIYEEYKESEN